MMVEDYRLSRYKGELNYLFILVCLIDFNFKSFRRFIIYLLHYGSLLDLRENPPHSITNEELLGYFEYLFPEPIPRKDLYAPLGINSRTTFNKLFGAYLKREGLQGRRSFSIYETYGILSFWQGEGNWGRLQAANKKTIATILHKGNYERTAEELTGALGEDYNFSNRFSPKQLKQVYKHLDLTEESDDEIEALVGYKEFEATLKFMFGAALAFDFFSKKKQK